MATDPFELDPPPLLREAARSAARPEEPPIARLRPGSDLHEQVKRKLLDRLEFSERAMSQLYPRWNYNEQALQAYVRLPDNEQALKDFNESGRPPRFVSIVVPYAYATQDAMVGYIATVLFGRRPIFPVDAVAGTRTEAAEAMEHVLQYNADHAQLIREGHQFIWDSATYGFGAFHVPYVEQVGMRTRVVQLFNGVVREKEERLIYSGNLPEAIDPYKFFPDPRVPISQVREKGDFVFWRSFMSRLDMRDMEAQGVFRYTEAVTEKLPRLSVAETVNSTAVSRRNQRVGIPGTSIDGFRRGTIEELVQIDQGTVKIIPAQWGLGPGKRVEKWLFTIANKDQIIQAQPLDMDHGQHPVVAAEPWSFGYDFGSLGATDFLIPFQETLSWLVNSRMHNVRATLNNMFVVDPSRIEMQDIERGGPGKIIRLKKAFYGSDVRMALTPLIVNDVTQGNLQDIQVVQRLADQVMGVNDNLRGMMTPGGRKSATEVRTSLEAGASRLARIAQFISSQAVVPLGQQMSINIQQYLPDEMAINILGIDGRQQQMVVTPEMIAGDFNFRISDGTLPFDKMALMDLWQQLLMGVAQDPELRARYSLGEIFEFVAELGGARNIKQFRREQAPQPMGVGLEVMPDEAVQREAEAGNIIPILGAMNGT